MTVAEVLAALGVDYRITTEGRVRPIPRRGSRWSLAERRERLREPVRCVQVFHTK